MANSFPSPLSPHPSAYTIKILDLGLARLGDHDESQAGLTPSGQVLGTPDYMAPEQWDDTHTVDARADLYSLGCTLYFLLTGKAPYSADKLRSVMHLMKAHIDGEIPNLTARCPDVPADLNAIYRRLLAKKPEERFQTAAEVAAALEPFVQRSRPESSRHVPRDEPSTVDCQPTIDVPHSTDDLSCTAASPSNSSDATEPLSLNHVEPEGSSRGAMTATLNAAASRGTSTTRRRAILVTSLLVCVVLAVVFSRVGRGTRPTDSTSSSRPSALAPQPSPGWHGWPADAPPPAIAPFNANDAQQHQEAWAKYLNVPVEYENSLGMKFRLIPPGEFLMGSTPGEVEETLKAIDPNDVNYRETVKTEVPRHKVILTKAFYLGTYEVTQKQHQEMMGTNPSAFGGSNVTNVIPEDLTGLAAGTDTSDFLVDSVNWSDGAEFCAKLSQKEKFKPSYFRAGDTVTLLDGNGYRLPTDAEWEYACRAGTTTPNWSGDKDADL